MEVIIYHNPRCSKSRATLELLQERGIEPVIVRYLEDPPDADQLADIARRLGVSAAEMLRTGEQAWKDLGLDASRADDATLFQAMAEHPILIQRP
ncbi:MAG: arsenate reductase (glutaredoxin), partial [Wenzhouxiangellaceae bacterium]